METRAKAPRAKAKERTHGSITKFESVFEPVDTPENINAAQTPNGTTTASNSQNCQ